MKKQRGMALYVLIIAVVLVLMLIIASVLAINGKMKENTDKKISFPYGYYYGPADDSGLSGMVLFDNGVSQQIICLKGYQLAGTDYAVYIPEHESSIDDKINDGTIDENFIEKKEAIIFGATTEIGSITVKDNKIFLDESEVGSVSDDFEEMKMYSSTYKKTDIKYTYCEHEWEEIAEKIWEKSCHKCKKCEVFAFHVDDNEDETCDKCNADIEEEASTKTEE